MAEGSGSGTALTFRISQRLSKLTATASQPSQSTCRRASGVRCTTRPARIAANPVQKSRVHAVRLMKAPRRDEETAEVRTACAGTYRPLAKTKNRPVRRIVAGTA
jgi:hypothetical protein